MNFFFLFKKLSGRSQVRKATTSGSLRLGPSELEFLRQASRRLALRAAESEAVGPANLPRLTMADFPRLP